MRTGVVKWFDEKKGFGFIKSGGKEYFLHYKELPMAGFKTCHKDDAVTFYPEVSPKGLIAKSVTIHGNDEPV